MGGKIMKVAEASNTMLKHLATLMVLGLLSSAFGVAPASAEPYLAAPAQGAGGGQVSQQVAQAAKDGEVEDDTNDPLEPVNRFIFGFNEAVYTMLLRPVATLYEAFVPPQVREAASNVIDNLKSPIVVLNDLLQGEGGRAWVATKRFAINSTYGVAGIFDRAEEMGLPQHKEDFGQTMAVWGVGEGFYLVLPVLGPSNPRDAVGKYVVDSFTDPFTMYASNTNHDEWNFSRMSVDGVIEYQGVKDELAQVKKTSIDYYAAIRSLYRQKRANEIKNGENVNLPDIPDVSYELDKSDFADEEAASKLKQAR